MTKTATIDDICHEHHLHLLSEKVVKWERIAYAVGLNEADTEVIKQNNLNDYMLQKHMILCKWKNKNGQNATYKFLVDTFTNINEIELAGALRDEIMKVPISSITEVMQQFKDHLVLRYR